MTTATIIKGVCYSIDFVVVLALIWHWMKQGAAEAQQDDATVWLQLTHLAKELPPENAVEFTPHSFLKSINWSIDGRSYNRLQSCLTRLQATSLEIYSKAQPTETKDAQEASAISGHKSMQRLKESLQEIKK